MKIRKHRIPEAIIISIACICIWMLYFRTGDPILLIGVVIGTIAVLIIWGNVFDKVRFKDDNLREVLK